MTRINIPEAVLNDNGSTVDSEALNVAVNLLAVARHTFLKTSMGVQHPDRETEKKFRIQSAIKAAIPTIQERFGLEPEALEIIHKGIMDNVYAPLNGQSFTEWFTDNNEGAPSALTQDSKTVYLLSLEMLYVRALIAAV